MITNDLDWETGHKTHSIEHSFVTRSTLVKGVTVDSLCHLTQTRPVCSIVNTMIKVCSGRIDPRREKRVLQVVVSATHQHGPNAKSVLGVSEGCATVGARSGGSPGRTAC